MPNYKKSLMHGEQCFKRETLIQRMQLLIEKYCAYGTFLMRSRNFSSDTKYFEGADSSQRWGSGTILYTC